MGKFWNKLKNFWREVLQKLIVRAVAGLIVLLIISDVAYTKRSFIKSYIGKILLWLGDEHHLKGSGFQFVYYFSLPLIIGLFLAVILWLCFHRTPKRYRGKRTVVPILAQWLKDNYDKLSDGKVVRFRDLDEENNLKRGSAKKYLCKIIDNHEKLRITYKSKYTAVITAHKG